MSPMQATGREPMPTTDPTAALDTARRPFGWQANGRRAVLSCVQL